MRVLCLVALFFFGSLSAIAGPSPKPVTPKVAKVMVDTSALFESIESMRDCAAAKTTHAAWKAEPPADEAKRLREAHADLLKKPVIDLSDEELEERRRLTAPIKEAEHRDAMAASAWRKREPEVESVCRRATTASLVKGTELTVMAKDSGYLKVKVETGRSTGLVGWILGAETDDAKVQ